jgi:hypothetical protein
MFIVLVLLNGGIYKLWHKHSPRQEHNYAKIHKNQSKNLEQNNDFHFLC